MNYNKKNLQYYDQLENGIAEMEATVERLRAEINELMEMKNALNHLNSLLKKELKELIGENHF
jgi:regulator of replication initiation timing